MKTFWLTFTDGTGKSCQGESEYHAKLIAEKFTGLKVAGGDYQGIAAEPLPYPSIGCIWRFDEPLHGKTPEFCHGGKQCAGRTSCPKNYSCTE